MFCISKWESVDENTKRAFVVLPESAVGYIVEVRKHSQLVFRNGYSNWDGQKRINLYDVYINGVLNSEANTSEAEAKKTGIRLAKTRRVSTEK